MCHRLRIPWMHLHIELWFFFSLYGVCVDGRDRVRWFHRSKGWNPIIIMLILHAFALCDWPLPSFILHGSSSPLHEWCLLSYTISARS